MKSRRICFKDNSILSVGLMKLNRDDRRGIKRSVAVVTGLEPNVGLGGTRLATWRSDAELVEDCMLLAWGMAAKSAFHQLPFTGGKVAVELHPDADKEVAFEAVGELVASCDGRLITTEDLGTSPIMMSAMARTAPGFVMGRPVSEGGSDDPSPYTAIGVMESIRAAVHAVMDGRSDLEGLRVFVNGIGHVGSLIVTKLLAEGVKVSLSDIDTSKLNSFRDHPGVTIVPAALDSPLLDLFSPEPLAFLDGVDVYCPCAKGGEIHAAFDLPGLKAIVGAANNQLASYEVAEALHRRGVTYVPDYAANGGGLISVAAEFLGRPREWAMTHAQTIGDRVADLLQKSLACGLPPLVIADEMAGHNHPTMNRQSIGEVLAV